MIKDSYLAMYVDVESGRIIPEEEREKIGKINLDH
jgi:hypothetical protein